MLSTVVKFGECCGSHPCQSMRSTLESLQSLLMRDEERETKHLQHLGGTAFPSHLMLALNNALEQLGGESAPVLSTSCPDHVMGDSSEYWTTSAHACKGLTSTQKLVVMSADDIDRSWQNAGCCYSFHGRQQPAFFGDQLKNNPMLLYRPCCSSIPARMTPPPDPQSCVQGFECMEITELARRQPTSMLHHGSNSVKPRCLSVH